MYLEENASVSWSSQEGPTTTSRNLMKMERVVSALYSFIVVYIVHGSVYSSLYCILKYIL